jgi:hypothetical protein
MVARVEAAPKRREKCEELEKPILVETLRGPCPLMCTVTTFAATICLFTSTLGRGRKYLMRKPQQQINLQG